MKDRKTRTPRGQSLVEVALALPVLVMLMMGLLDLGRAFYAMVTLNDAAQEGAAYAATNQDPGAVMARVGAAEATFLVPLEDIAHVDDGGSPVLFDMTSSGAVGSGVVITVTYDMPIYTPFVNGLVGGGDLRLRATANHVIISLDN